MAPSRVRSRAGVLAAAAVLGCHGSQSALDPRGPHAEQIYDLWNVMLVGGTVVLVVVTTLVVIAVALPRAAANERRRLYRILLGAAATTIILVALVAYNATTARAISTNAVDPIDVRVTARQWWWDITYVGDPPSRSARTANELWIPVGRPVRIELVSADVIHSFWVPNLHGKRDVIPGRTNELWIQADVPGTYRGQCAEFCGLQHAQMAFLVIAVPAPEYEAWLEGQRAPAAPPADDVAERGQAVFLERCASCHTVRGTIALASVAPDLTHLASRRTLAAAILPNRRGHLAGWILDPQHTKPGAFMPPVELEAEHLHALLHYLESLR